MMRALLTRYAAVIAASLRLRVARQRSALSAGNVEKMPINMHAAQWQHLRGWSARAERSQSSRETPRGARMPDEMGEISY